ncbi:MAG: type II toxin-antitoxin system HicA family toxin [Gammaproteobacteria bacterium]|nr:type II toxin-antitoxin system HicA family toxin [Gammaproteobacteria bacterium]
MVERFPRDAPLRNVIRAFRELDFEVVREGNHIPLQRTNDDGTVTPMTTPNHTYIKSSTLRAICSQTGVTRTDFLDAYERV